MAAPRACGGAIGADLAVDAGVELLDDLVAGREAPVDKIERSGHQTRPVIGNPSRLSR